MLIGPALVCLALFLQDKPAASAPDHSGEAKLRQIFESCGSVRDVHLAAVYYSLESIPQRYNLSSSGDIWLGRGGRFRIVTSSDYWGGGSLAVSDGLALLTDSMSDDEPLTVKKAPKTMHEVNDSEPWLFVFEGAAGYEALVDKEKAITLGNNKMGDFVDFTGRKVGRVLMYYRERSGSPFPTMYETYAAPWWADDPGDGTLPFTRSKLNLVQVSGVPLSTFSVKPPTGHKVNDTREKKSFSRA